MTEVVHELGELQGLLEQLADEYSLLGEAEDRAREEREKIKKQVIRLTDQLVREGVRVKLPLEKVGSTWDRRIQRRGGGLDPVLLEERVGTRTYRRVCDSKRVYELSSAKLLTARKKGWITEEDIESATLPPKLVNVLYLLEEVSEDDE